MFWTAKAASKRRSPKAACLRKCYESARVIDYQCDRGLDPITSRSGKIWESGYKVRCQIMHVYKTELRQHLTDDGWEVIDVVASEDWWADEFWKVQSRRNLWGHEIVLTFLVDPMWDAPRKKGQAVWAIAATEEMPSDRLGAEAGIAALCMTKGRFNENLEAFVAAIDARPH